MSTLLAIVTCLIVALTIQMTLRIIYGERGPAPNDQIYLVLNVLRWAFYAAAGMAMLALAMGWLVILFAAMIAVAAHFVSARHQEVQRRILLSTVAFAVERGMPLTAPLDALAREQPVLGGAAERLARLLASGTPLPSAIQKSRRAFPESAGVFAHAGETVGAVGPALHEAAAQAPILQATWDDVTGRVGYVFTVLACLLVVGTFLMVRVVPAYQEIFDDSGVPLPALTRAFLEASDRVHDFFLEFGYYLSLPLFFVSGIFIPVAAVVLLIVFLITSFLVLGYGMGWIRGVPLVDRLLVRAHSAVVLRCLALVVQRSGSFSAATRAMSAVYPRRLVRSKLRKVAESIERGEDWCESLRRQRLIGQADAALLRSAQRLGNLPWALREVADRGVRRLSYRLQTMVQLISACIVLTLGVLVMLVVVAMFMPLVRLITGMA